MAYPGYTLFAPMNFTNTYLVDNKGQIVNRWSSSFRTGHAVYLLPNGNLLRSAMDANSNFGAGGRGGRLEEYDWDGNLVWEFTYSDSMKRHHHDALKLPNGNVLLVAWELKTMEEAIAAGRDPSTLNQDNLWPDTLIEVEPTGSSGGTIVWEWHAWDHLIQDFDSTKENYGVVEDHPELIDINFFRTGNADWLHFNGIDYHAELDQILISTPFFNEIWVIDHSTTTAEAASHAGGNQGKGGDILYRWGNPLAYRAGTAADQTLFNQHNAQWIDPGLPGEENILIFNNGRLRPGGQYSSIDELIPPLTETGGYTLSTNGIYGPESLEWSYQADPPSSFFASFVSGAQRLPNGNTLVCDGPIGTFFEVTTNQVEVWRYINPTGSSGPVAQGQNRPNNAVFRATRYGLDYPGLAGRDLTPQGTVELIPFNPFHVVEISPDGSSVTLSWTSVPDRMYAVLYRSELDETGWETLTTIQAIGTLSTFVDTDSERIARGAGFYRVRQL